MLEVNNLSIKYGDKLAVDKFNMSLKSGQIISLVGESGSGKTTVLRSLIGNISGSGQLFSGDVKFKNKSLFEMSEFDLRQIRGPEIAMIFQDSRSFLDPIQKIGQQFYEYINTHQKISRSEADELTYQSLERVNLKNPHEVMNSYPSNLSGGMVQRVGIAMALLLEPDLLLADEPTSALDMTSQARIIQELKEIVQESNTAIVLVTHNLGVASYLADYIIVMKNGQIIEEGDTFSVIENPSENYTKELIQSIPQIGGYSYVE